MSYKTKQASVKRSTAKHIKKYYFWKLVVLLILISKAKNSNKIKMKTKNAYRIFHKTKLLFRIFHRNHSSNPGITQSINPFAAIKTPIYRNNFPTNMELIVSAKLARI